MPEINFNPLTVDLGGAKLIEASAGTGKTYSVAILVLRLIIEKGIPVEKILMVTFTNAAVAELESRIRKFIRLAYKYISGGKDLNEKDNIRRAVEFQGKIHEEKKELLRMAVQNLDSLSVMTIHSFCQKTIDEFTFETNQSFDYEIVTDDSVLLKDASDKYFREVLNTLDIDLFKEIRENLKPARMSELLRRHLAGMKFLDSELNAELAGIKETRETKLQALAQAVIDNFDKIKAVETDNRTDLGRSKTSPEAFLPVFINFCCRQKKYIKEFEFIYYPYGKEYSEACDIQNVAYLDFFRKSEEALRKLKQLKGYISYDDQIKTIHAALGNESFKKKLAEKYLAVFIDEFQDTDKLQYEIFSTVFSGNSEIFYIGDPKQSIYGWRGADLDTYKLAKESVGGAGLPMDKNYRSTKDMIDALNILLNPDESFNMFMDEGIRYSRVGQGASEPGEMTDCGNPVKPVTVWEFESRSEAVNFRAVSQEIYRLLTDDVKIKGAKITPGDIGVLVRDNREGDKIKEELAKLDIPSVKRDDTKVLKSEESALITYLIRAVVSPSRGNINRALNSPYFGFSSRDLKTTDDEKHIGFFMDLRKILKEEGVYNMISKFLSIYGVRSRCMKDVMGQRVLTNIIQIAEIMHKVEKKSRLTPEELLVWINRHSDEGNEEFEQRIESDEDAVQISTIHKAKGLEYKIVFAPCLSMIPKKKLLEKGRVNDFKKNGEYYFTLNYKGLSEDDKKLFDLQKEQENRRLIYVALTRAIYKCYVSLVPGGTVKKPCGSSLSAILDRYGRNSELIEIKDPAGNEAERRVIPYQPPEEKKVFSPRRSPEFVIKNPFGIHSFSALSTAHKSAPFEKADLADKENYDRFIFQELGRGANVGTALHSIFERLNFSKPDTWLQTINEASKYYRNIIREKDEMKNTEGNIDLIYQMVSHVMRAEINIQGGRFRLCDIDNERKLPELEFYFSVDKVNRQVINQYLGEDAKIGGDSNIEGLMTGFMDLMFEHDKKYYILDWKSNHLGNDTEFYDLEGMKTAMGESNYHLQYMIYTVALKRWLDKRIAGFDFDSHFGGVIYIFLRGVREGRQTGIYTNRPEKEQIDDLDAALSGMMQPEKIKVY